MKKDTQKELLKIVRHNYESDAETFNLTRNKKNWPPILDLLEKVQEGNSVLDVGCGNGRLLEVLAEKKIKYVGLDLSENLIKVCREKYPDYKFEVGEISNLGILPEYDFDFVFCIAVLHHLPGEDLRLAALKQLKNKISADGKIVLSVWNMWPLRKYRKMILKFALLKLIKKNDLDFGDVLFDWRAPNSQMSKRYYHAFRAGELKRLIKKAGLKIEKYFKDDFNYYLILTK